MLRDAGHLIGAGLWASGLVMLADTKVAIVGVIASMLPPRQATEASLFGVVLALTAVLVASRAVLRP